jgi:tetratricopeptide (TPR) repeat protein
VSAQCNAPEVVPAADTYNAFVCKGYRAMDAGNYQEALKFFLSASKGIVAESPNMLLFARIAYVYAKIGRFGEADEYLRYDNLALLWAIGVVRCERIPGSEHETLRQDGVPLSSSESKHMADVLCGGMLDDMLDLQARDAAGFVPVAQMILRHTEIRREIEKLRPKK